MLRKCFLVPVLGALALLLVADAAQAQRLRERRMERRDSRRGVVYDPYLSNTYDSTLGYSMMPGTSGLQGLTPTVQTTANARISFYQAPSANLNDCCEIRVVCPDPNCKVMFDGKATSSRGMDRAYLTPALPAGVPCTYTIRCTWTQDGQEMTREQTLNCGPNMVCVVDFTAPNTSLRR